MHKILGFLIALVETRKNAQDFRRALRTQYRIGAGKTRRVETRIGFAPQPGIVRKQSQFSVLRDIDAGVLQKRDDIIGGVAKDTVLKIDNSHAGDAVAPGKPDEIWRMIIAQRPCWPRGKDSLNRVTPKIDESRLDAGSELRADDIGQIPIEQQFDFDRQRIDVINRNPVRLIVADWQSVGKIGVVQMRERGERDGVAFLDDAAFKGHRLAAEILDDGKPSVKVEGKDLRRRKTMRAQTFADRDERPDILGEFGDGAIGFAIANRRSIRARR